MTDADMDRNYGLTRMKLDTFEIDVSDNWAHLKPGMRTPGRVIFKYLTSI